MPQIRKSAKLAGAAIAGLVFADAAHAAVVASDTASNSPYSTVTGANNFNGQNGGFGFGPWSVTDSPAGDTNGGVFISATTNDTVRNPAPVFDLFDNGNPSSSNSSGAALGSSIETATRPFALSLTGTGSSFSFIESLAALRPMNGSSVTSQVGFELLDSAGLVLLNLYANGGGTGYFVTDASNSGNPYLLFSTDAAHSGANSRALTLNSGSTDTITITLNDSAGDYTITSAGHEGSTFADGGQINMSTGGPAAFAFYNNNGGNGSDIRLNNLNENVVPEPASIMLGGLGVFTLLLRRRR
jgi:hypothetical protein